MKKADKLEYHSLLLTRLFRNNKQSINEQTNYNLYQKECQMNILGDELSRVRDVKGNLRAETPVNL